MFSLEHSLDTIGPHLDPRGQAVAGYGPEAHEEDIHLLEEVVEKVHNYQNVFYRTSVLERDASPGKLGRLPMPAMGHSMGIPNMHDILMFKAKGDEISREKATAAYDFDKYMQALEMWSKFLDMVVAPMPKKMTLEEVERSSDAGGIIDTMITKVLALAKLVPGSHADMVPLLLYMTTQRILAHFRKRTERTVVLHYLKERFSEACQKGNGLDAFATQMAPFLKMFGVGELDAADRADLTYLDHQYHKDFAPVDDDTMEKRVEEVTIAEWNEKHPGQPHPPIIGHARPPWAAGINEVTGYITEDMLEFWAAIENNDPPTPADRKGGIKDDAKQK